MRWVDPETTSPAEEQTGSAIAPFATMSAALASLQETELGTGTLILADGDYGAQGLVWTIPVEDQVLEVIGFGNAWNLGTVSVEGESGNLKLQGLGNESGGAFSFESSIAMSVAFVDCYFIGNIDCPSSSISFRDTTVIGTVEADEVESAIDSVINTLTTTGRLSATNTLFGSLTTSDQINLTGCHCETIVTVNTGSIGLVASDTVFRQGVSFAGSSMQATDCYFTGFDGDLVDGGSMLMQGGRCDLPITCTEDIQLHSVVCSGILENESPITCRSAIIQDTAVAGNLTADIEMEIDSFSLYAARSLGFAISYDSLNIIDPPLQITLSIVVPAVAADAIAYVNTSLVGTNLEDAFLANGPVIVNPQSDLVAAGAGGGFLNARISAANTLRCCFQGALAGGAANFTVSRGR